MRRHGRVPFLRRLRPRLGVAGAAAHAAEDAVSAHERDPRRHGRRRGRAQGAHGRGRGRDRRRAAPGAPVLRVRRDAPRGHGGAGPAQGGGAAVPRAFLSGRGAGLGAGALELRSGHERAARPGEGGVARHPLHHGVRQDAQAASAKRGGRASRRDAAALPAARGEACPAGASARHLRHGHARRGHQRAHPHRGAHRALEVRRPQDAPPARSRVPPDRRAGGQERLRHRGRGGGPRARARDREREARREGGGRSEEAAQGQEEAASRGLRHLERADVPALDRGRPRNAQAAPARHAFDGTFRSGPGRRCLRARAAPHRRLAADRRGEGGARRARRRGVPNAYRGGRGGALRGRGRLGVVRDHRGRAGGLRARPAPLAVSAGGARPLRPRGRRLRARRRLARGGHAGGSAPGAAGAGARRAREGGGGDEGRRHRVRGADGAPCRCHLSEAFRGRAGRRVRALLRERAVGARLRAVAEVGGARHGGDGVGLQNLRAALQDRALGGDASALLGRRLPRA